MASAKSPSPKGKGKGKGKSSIAKLKESLYVLAGTKLADVPSPMPTLRTDTFAGYCSSEQHRSI